MPRLIWSPPALRDVARLYRFLAPKNPEAARRAAKTTRQGVKLLLDHPQAGRSVEEMPQNVRELLIGFGAYGYVVVYSYEAGDIVVLSVRHAREAG